MSNRLGIAQSNRLRTYELLKGQSESVQRRVLGPNSMAKWSVSTSLTSST